MSTTIEQDELVKFAANKVGGEEHDGCVEIHDWQYEATVEHGGPYAVPAFDLSSWELLVKGMEACSYAFSIGQHRAESDIATSWTIAFIGEYPSGEIGHARKDPASIADIPLDFWKCWYELEHPDAG